MKNFLIKGLLVIFIASILSIGVDLLYLSHYKLSYEFPKNLLPYKEIDQKYQLVKLGNSHSDEGLTFSKYNIKSLSLTGQAQTFQYDLALLKMHEKEINDNAVIIISVSPISFSQIKPTKEMHLNTPYYDGRLSPFLIPDIRFSEYLQVQIVPFTRAGYLWRNKYAKEQEELSLKPFVEDFNQTHPSKPTPIISQMQNFVRPSQLLATPTIDPMELKKTFFESQVPTYNVSEIRLLLAAPHVITDEKLTDSRRFIFNKWYTSGGFDKKWFATNRDDLEQIIEYSLAHHWRPVIVTIPISEELQSHLEKGYMKTYIYDNLSKMDLHDVDYFNFSNDKQLTEHRYFFKDSDHLNPRGASIVSYLLLQHLIEKGYFPKEVDGYDYSPSKIVNILVKTGGN